MQGVGLDSSNVTLPTLGAAEGGAAGRDTEVEAQEAAEQARNETSERAEPNIVRDEALGRTVDVLA